MAAQHAGETVNTKHAFKLAKAAGSKNAPLATFASAAVITAPLFRSPPTSSLPYSRQATFRLQTNGTLRTGWSGVLL